MCHTKNNSLVALNPVSSLSYPPTTVTAYRELRDEFTLRLVRFDKNRIEAQQFFVASDALLRRNVLSVDSLLAAEYSHIATFPTDLCSLHLE